MKGAFIFYCKIMFRMNNTITCSCSVETNGLKYVSLNNPKSSEFILGPD